jgi:hypothetical protein
MVEKEAKLICILSLEYHLGIIVVLIVETKNLMQSPFPAVKEYMFIGGGFQGLI